MSDAVLKPENDYLNTLRKGSKRVTIFLVNGIKLTGVIQSFDSYPVFFNAGAGSQLTFKHAISTVSEDEGSPSSVRRTRPERRARSDRRLIEQAREPRQCRHSPVRTQTTRRVRLIRVAPARCKHRRRRRLMACTILPEEWRRDALRRASHSIGAFR